MTKTYGSPDAFARSDDVIRARIRNDNIKHFKEFAAAIKNGSVAAEDVIEFAAAHPDWLRWWEDKRAADIKNWQSTYVRTRRHTR